MQIRGRKSWLIGWNPEGTKIRCSKFMFRRRRSRRNCIRRLPLPPIVSSSSSSPPSYMKSSFACLIASLCCLCQCSALLSVQQNEIRSLDCLDGLWTFVREPVNSQGIGFLQHWPLLDLSTFPNSTLLPVPAAFNELSAERELREHVGWVWYQREFRVPERTLLQPGRRSFLRFGSVQYNAVVFLNGREVGQHTGGHLPFQFEVDLTQSWNTLTVAVNNTLSDETIPPGDFRIVKVSTGDIVSQTPNFDFFNYAGILRPVHLWHLPQALISAIKIIADSTVDVDYKLVPAEQTAANVAIYLNRTKVAQMPGLQNSTRIPNARLWWPRGMGSADLYMMEVTISLTDGTLLDVYRETFGFRTVSIRGKQIFINGRPFYCHGFGMHEDFAVHGRGFDRSVMVKDLNMFHWLNGNCYRTSHYPYSEERAYEADRRGIAVITEVPAVGLRVFNRTLQKLHARMIMEMVMRDRNHPSVIIWSLANEPEVKKSAQEYFSELVVLTKHLDATRPVTLVFGHLSELGTNLASSLDLVCVNLYFGWYSDLALLGAIKEHLVNEINSLQEKLQKPLMLSEYGAEAIAGLHSQPGLAFSEEYQVEVILKTAEALDLLRAEGQIAGEMIWNFADFMTSQNLARVMGNHKGVLTRDRQPKMGAFMIRERYRQLLEETQKQIDGTRDNHI